MGEPTTEEAAPAPGPLRVAFAVSFFPSTSQTFILRQITGLLDLGHDVRILAERRPQGQAIAHPAVRDYGLEEKVTYVHADGHARGALVGVLGKLLLENPGSLGLMRRDRAAPHGGRRVMLSRLKGLLDGSRPDVLHCHFGNVGLRYAEPGSHLGIPHIVSFYGWDCSGLPRKRGQGLYEPLFRKVDRVTVLSDSMSERLVQLGCPAGVIRKHHLGVDPSEYSHRDRVAPPAGQPVRLLTVGRLVEKKGLRYCLEALAKVVRSPQGAARGLRYDIIGDGPLRGDLEAQTSELGLDDYAHIFLLSSATAEDGDEEGTPTVLLEASSTGLPVISTWHSGIPETVLDGETGFLVPERDAGALAERLCDLLDHPELWVTMGRNGRRHVEASFDIRTLARDLVQHYRDVMERPVDSARSPQSFSR
jgi:colanic acid/amylovoran biosynthesis glycosyltransferase